MKKLLSAAGKFLQIVGILTFASFCLLFLLPFIAFLFVSHDASSDLPEGLEFANMTRKTVKLGENTGVKFAVCEALESLDGVFSFKGLEEMDDEASRIWAYIQKNKALFAPELDAGPASGFKAAYNIRSWKSGMEPYEAEFLLYDSASGRCWYFVFNGGAGGLK